MVIINILFQFQIAKLSCELSISFKMKRHTSQWHNLLLHNNSWLRLRASEFSSAQRYINLQKPSQSNAFVLLGKMGFLMFSLQ